MWILYRDELGIVIHGVEGTVSFLDGSVYFTTTDGEDMKIKMKAVMEIGRCAE